MKNGKAMIAALGLMAAMGGVTALSLGIGPAERADGFALAGFSLGPDERDFRVNNNFLDATANDNATPQANYPGHTGAVMAIWKAHSEWASGPHGDGTGDPLGGNVIGSGGANFDNTFQGATTDGPGLNNLHIASNLGGGVLAFTEQFGGGGWVIRYNEALLWDDGPGEPGAGAVDIQAIATHEVGHTLGLGHSSAAGATMSATVGSPTAARSLEADDIAGIQAIYGVAAATKPRIDATSAPAGGAVVGTTLTLSGVNFSATGNEVWFTNAAGGGVPAEVLGLTSSGGGTSLTLRIPGDAVDGDVLVKSGAGGGHSTLSNAFPLDLVDGAGFVDVGPGLGGASGTPIFTGEGDPTAGTGALTLSVQDVAPSASGLWFIGLVEGAAPFLGGTLYPFPWVTSVPVQVLPDGSLSFGGTVPAGAEGLSVVNQMWFHDATGPFGATATNGLRIDIP